jgi:hypothetical protein
MGQPDILFLHLTGRTEEHENISGKITDLPGENGLLEMCTRS